jgi:hypothetical protein
MLSLVTSAQYLEVPAVYGTPKYASCTRLQGFFTKRAPSGCLVRRVVIPAEERLVLNRFRMAVHSKRLAPCSLDIPNAKSMPSTRAQVEAFDPS